MKKWILYPVIALASLIALAYLVGLTRDPELITTASIEISRPQELVYQLIADPHQIPKYFPEVKQIEIVNQNPLRYRMVASGGTGTIEVVTADPPRRNVTKTVEHSMGVDAVWDIMVTPTAGGSRIDLKATMQFHNPLLRTMTLLMDAKEEEMKTLRAIKTYAESH